MWFLIPQLNTFHDKFIIMHKIMLKIEVQRPKIIAKLYKDMVTLMEHRVNEVWLLCNNEQLANV